MQKNCRKITRQFKIETFDEIIRIEKILYLHIPFLSQLTKMVQGKGEALSFPLHDRFKEAFSGWLTLPIRIKKAPRLCKGRYLLGRVGAELLDCPEGL